MQPKFFGMESCTEKVSRVIEEFQKDRGIEVILEIVSRDEISALLSGEKSENMPDVVFSTEWPYMPVWLEPLTECPEERAYLPIAQEYWTEDGMLMAVPSYVQWTCMAVLEGEDDPIVGYFNDSPGFFPSCLGNGHRSSKSYIEAVKFVKNAYGPLDENPLTSWKKGEIQGLFPVNPNLLRWLRFSSENSTVSLKGIPDLHGKKGIPYTVPSYIVTPEGTGPKKEAAFDLACTLARALGTWAARSFGGIPANLNDLCVFNVESGFSQDERAYLLTSLGDSPCLKRAAGDEEIAKASEEFLKGIIDEGEMAERISRVLSTHNNP